MKVRQDDPVSPVSRNRKSDKPRRSDRRILRPVVAVPEECDCPECSGADFDPQALIDDLAAGAAGLLAGDDPLEAELFGASFVAAGRMAGEEFTEALAEGIVPALAQLSTPESVGALVAIGAVESGVGAADAARLLIEGGLPAPAWMSALDEPIKAGICRRYSDSAGEASMLLCAFERSGRSHGFLVQVDHTDCDAAAEIMLLPGEVLDQVTGRIASELNAEELDPAELRWQVERALDARAVHDTEDDALGLDDAEEDGHDYHTLAVVVRARMGVLPEPPRPPAAHGDNDRQTPLDLVKMLTRFTEPIPAGRRQVLAPARKLPAKRKKSDGPAPIYQIKVSLRGARPPIWRRLELPGDTSLADLHHIIQTVFGWEDSHLHAFETPYGTFGVADRELGHRAEKPVTLEQVATGVGDKARYLYDFGDNWEHEITVEKLLDRQAVQYPRCTGGRRAAPPDDCGGIWGYADLLDILADPTHPEHSERLEWLGLTSAEDLDPTRFDAAEATRMLAEPR
ncbi:plasmid pRiA4b ORF-3 family protein [Actinoplanes sp. NBRC 103695]|uniref:plasmid pRiA4b ORF-3 family protein n=1 Tax=Actinoplanes sp. NBRC 103695 TaxID=3032202 RepID=UPI0024A5C015|nr:plasmid pRiA4b ORF-3 family protein [Actinoplanes sp. NBRC 103695]GLY96778.1 hypothetical protein Acsp02_40320 [Actinoplanes sp. NBRC 103695]